MLVRGTEGGLAHPGPLKVRVLIDAISPADDEAATAMWAAPETQAAIGAFLTTLKERETAR